MPRSGWCHDSRPRVPTFARAAFTGGSRGCGQWPRRRDVGTGRLAAIRLVPPFPPPLAAVRPCRVHGRKSRLWPGVATWARGRRLPDRSLFVFAIGFAESGQGPPNPGSSLGPQVKDNDGRPRDGEQGNGGPTEVIVPPGSSQFGLEGCRNNVRHRANEPSAKPKRQQDL